MTRVTFSIAATTAFVFAAPAFGQTKCEVWKDSEFRCSNNNRPHVVALVSNKAGWPAVVATVDTYSSHCGTPGSKVSKVVRFDRANNVRVGGGSGYASTGPTKICHEVFIHSCHSPLTPSRMEKCRLVLDVRPGN